MDILTIKNLLQKLSKLNGKKGAVTKEDVMFYWLQDIDQTLANFRDTSLNQDDRRARMKELANKLSILS